MMLLYNILFLLGGALGLPFFVVRALTLEKRKTTIFKRLTMRPSCLPLPTRPIWIHALSVGEVLSSATLVKKLKKDYPEHPLVFSVSTRSGYEIAHKSLAGETECIFFFPYDIVWITRNIIRHIAPSVFFLIETDLWPNFLNELNKQGVPAILVNGRISSASYKRYKKAASFARYIMGKFACCCMQTETDAGRIISMGAPRDRVYVTGNIKFDQPPLCIPAEEIEKLRVSLKIGSKSRVFVAGSTHEGEEGALLSCFKALRRSFSDVVLVVAPRDPVRASRLQQMFAAAEFAAVLRTEVDKLTRGLPDVVIVNTIGELRRLYAIADVVFVGKSLVNLGGQNPLEPAALKKPILFGPYMFNFELIARMLLENGAAVEVRNDAELSRQVKALLLDGKHSRSMGERAYEVFCMNRGAVDRTLRVAESFLRPAFRTSSEGRDHDPSAPK